MTENNQLSDRELEILKLVATGATNKEIARELSISVNTVKVHLRNVYSKLEVSSRTEATIYAVQNGIVQHQVNQTEEDSENETSSQGIASRWKQNTWVWVAGIFLIGIIFIALVIFGITWRNNRRALIAPTPEIEQFLDEERWQEHANMPTSRKNFAVALYDNQIYVVGGEITDGVTGTAERYDPENDSWESLPSKEIPVTDVGAVSIGGNIFVPGGRLATGDVTDVLEMFDPVEDQWFFRAPLPEAISAYALAAFEGKLYLFGGWDGEAFVNFVYRYDPSIDNWEEMTPMPTARGYAGAALSGEGIFVIGGYDGKTAFDVNEEYLPGQDNGTNDPWTTCESLPEKRYRMGVVSVAGIIHIIGGNDSSVAYKYFPQQDTWHSFQAVEHSWSSLGVTTVGEMIYSMGGEVNSQLSSYLYSYKAVYSIMVPILP